MHVNYEYILAGLILLIILSVSSLNVVSIMTHHLSKLEQKSEYPMAGRILDVLLLSSGSPVAWGDESDDPDMLGFALGNALESYVLDIAKVSRLMSDNAHYIYPGKARQLMGLSGDYHFNLTIMPTFAIDVANVSIPAELRFEIKVVDHKGFWVSNANVTGFYVPNSLTGEEYLASTSAITDLTGDCTLVFAGLSPSPDHSLVVCVDQLRVKCAKTYPTTDLKVKVEEGYVLGSDHCIIPEITYSTGSVFALDYESAFRYAEIEGLTYYVRFDLWW